MAEHEKHDQGHGGGEGGGHKGGHKKGGHHGGGHGGEHHEEGVPEWMISFADNALLQMGFFVILMALNMGPKAKSETAGEGDQSGGPSADMLDFAIAVREGFNNPVKMNSTDPRDQPLIKRLQERSGGKSPEPGPKGDKEDVQSIRPGDYYRLGGVIHFEDNSSEIKPLARRDAANIGIEMQGRNTVIEVRGYASAQESYPDIQKGRMLSYERGFAVARILADNGVKWNQLRIVACGDNDPIKPLASDKNEYRVNQRVEVIATEDLVPKDPYSSEPGAE